jgi:hypothetical protein
MANNSYASSLGTVTVGAQLQDGLVPYVDFDLSDSPYVFRVDPSTNRVHVFGVTAEPTEKDQAVVEAEGRYLDALRAAGYPDHVVEAMNEAATRVLATYEIARVLGGMITEPTRPQLGMVMGPAGYGKTARAPQSSIIKEHVGANWADACSDPGDDYDDEVNVAE